MLNKGKLKCYYFNNKDAEIYLSDAALKDLIKKVAKDVLTGQQGPHYTTKFGDLKSFKKKLDQAKAEKKLVNYDFKKQVTGRIF
jgi:cell division protease FtsH